MQGQGVIVILTGGRVDARQVVAIEHHGDGLIQRIQFIQELLSGLIGNLHTLLIGLNRLLFIITQRRTRGGFGGVVVILIPLVVGHVILHGNDLDEFVRLAGLDAFQRRIIGRLIRNVRRLVDLVLILDHVRTGQRVEVREAELLVVRGTRVHAGFVRMIAERVGGRAPHLVDGGGPMLARDQLLVRAGQGGIEIGHAQAGKSHVFEVGRTAAVAGGEHQAGGGARLDLADVGHRILAGLQSRHAARVGEGFGQHVHHCRISKIIGAGGIDHLRFLLVASGDLLHGLLGVVARLVHDLRVELAGKGYERTVALRVIHGIPHGWRVSQGAGELVGQRIGGAHMHAVQREHQNRQQQQDQTGREVQAAIIRLNHAAFASVGVPQRQYRDEQHGEHGERDEDGHVRAGRGEGEHVAGIGAEEPEIGGQDGLVADLDFEMLDDGHDDPGREHHDARGPEPVEQHQEHKVQQRDKYHVEHEHEVAIGPHLAHEAEPDGGTRQLHAGGARRNAHFERRHDDDVEDNEEHAVHPAGEGLVGVLGRDFIGFGLFGPKLEMGFHCGGGGTTSVLAHSPVSVCDFSSAYCCH